MFASLPTTILNSVTDLPTFQFDAVALFLIDSNTAIRKLLYTIRNHSRLFRLLESLQSGKYDTR